MDNFAMRTLLRKIDAKAQAGMCRFWKEDIRTALREIRDLVAAPLIDKAVEPAAHERIYETIISWDEGGGKRSRRELARRIEGLISTSAAPVVPEAEAVAMLRKLYKATVGILEGGRAEIIRLGGACDPVDRMEACDPTLREVRALLATHDAKKAGVQE